MVLGSDGDVSARRRIGAYRLGVPVGAFTLSSAQLTDMHARTRLAALALHVTGTSGMWIDVVALHSSTESTYVRQVTGVDAKLENDGLMVRHRRAAGRLVWW